jgi:hypothetical protein
MKCVCDKKAKVFHCYGEGVVHEIRVFEGDMLIKSYVCSEDIDVIIVEGKVIVIRSRQEDSDKEYIWVDVYL